MTYARLSCTLLLLCALAASPAVLAQNMKIETRSSEEDVRILDLHGKLIIGDGDVALREAVKEALEARVRNILINLVGTGVIDSLGVAALIRIGAEARQGGATFKLLHVEDKVQEVLEMTRLIGVFETYDDEIEALGSFGNHAKSKRIYVGNLPFSASDDEVRHLFSEFGEVNSVSLISNPTTGRPAGFGFVEMETATDAADAIQALHQSQMGGRSLNVNEARPREDRRLNRDGW